MQGPDSLASRSTVERGITRMQIPIFARFAGNCDDCNCVWWCTGSFQFNFAIPRREPLILMLLSIGSLFICSHQSGGRRDRALFFLYGFHAFMPTTSVPYSLHTYIEEVLLCPRVVGSALLSSRGACVDCSSSTGVGDRRHDEETPSAVLMNRMNQV